MNSKIYGRYLTICIITMFTSPIILWYWLGAISIIFSMHGGVLFMLLGRCFWDKEKDKL